MPHLMSPTLVTWSTLGLLSPMLALAGVAVLFQRRPRLATTLGFGVALVTIALAAVIKGLGAPVLLVCVASVGGRRRALGVAAFIAALWVIGSFYYWLGWPLVDKAALMVAVGVTLGVLCLVTGGHRPAVPLTFGSAAVSVRFGSALIGIGAFAVAGCAGHAIQSSEQILANGRPVYLALQPVDPRSLMQGDYMALNFALPNDAIIRAKPAPGQRLWAIATVDERRLARIIRITSERPATSADEMLFELKPKNQRWIVGTDAWFFKEGPRRNSRGRASANSASDRTARPDWSTSPTRI